MLDRGAGQATPQPRGAQGCAHRRETAPGTGLESAFIYMLIGPCKNYRVN